MSVKVLIPVVLFLVLNPMTFSFESVATRAALFVPLYWTIAKVTGITLTKADLIVPSLLFLLLSPGVLLTIPPGTFRSGETNFNAVVVHSIILGAVFMLLRRQFPEFY